MKGFTWGQPCWSGLHLRWGFPPTWPHLRDYCPGERTIFSMAKMLKSLARQCKHYWEKNGIHLAQNKSFKVRNYSYLRESSVSSVFLNQPLGWGFCLYEPCCSVGQNPEVIATWIHSPLLAIKDVQILSIFFCIGLLGYSIILMQ